MKNKFLLCFMIFSVLVFVSCSEKKSKECESEKSSVTVNKAAKNFADALSNSVEKYGEKINDSTKKYSDEITKSVKEYSDELSESMKKAADEFSNTVNSKEFKQSVEETKKSISETAEKYAKDAKNSATNFLQSAADALNSLDYEEWILKEFFVDEKKCVESHKSYLKTSIALFISLIKGRNFSTEFFEIMF